MKYRKSARKRRKLGDSMKNSESKKSDKKSHQVLRRTSERRKADSAYETDKSSFLSSDPYDLNMIDEFLCEETKIKEKIVFSRSKSQLRSSKAKKKESKKSDKVHGVNSTSTPVLQSGNHGKKQRYSKDSSSVTPEVTPILPSKPFECASPINNSFVTPQLPRSVCKYDSEKNELLNISKQLTYSSHTDSGIDLNPPPIKKKLSETFQIWSLTINENQKKRQKTKENNFVNIKAKKEKSDDIRILSVEKKKNKSCFNLRENSTKHSNFQDQNNSILDSCFGFNSIESPQSSCAEFVKKSKNVLTLVQSTQKIPFKDLSNNVMNQNIMTSSSPPYFCEDIYSQEPECLSVNKSSTKTYKPTSSRKDKNRLSVSKIDAWAANFNMEIEEAERFDLNVE